MSSAPPPKMRDGSPYSGHTQFLGGGIRRSCGKCGQFFQTGMKKVRPWGLCCEKCRGAN